MNVENIAGIISSVGFPVVLSIYLVSRIDNRLAEIAKTLVELSERIIRVADDIENRQWIMQKDTCKK